jgi:hypothetical protein
MSQFASLVECIVVYRRVRTRPTGYGESKVNDGLEHIDVHATYIGDATGSKRSAHEGRITMEHDAFMRGLDHCAHQHGPVTTCNGRGPPAHGNI